MSEDRAVHTDALKTLGTIIGETERRDAIHLAVEPVIAAHVMKPGEHIGLLSNGQASRYAEQKFGIVDPFLTDTIATGERFWLIIYPRKITSLRHVWEHPAFESAKTRADDGDDVKVAQAKAVIQMEADNHGISYQEMMWGAQENAEHGQYLIDGSRWDGEGVYGDAATRFWDAYEVVTGRKVSDDNRRGIFSCSC